MRAVRCGRAYILVNDPFHKGCQPKLLNRIKSFCPTLNLFARRFYFHNAIGIMKEKRVVSRTHIPMQEPENNPCCPNLTLSRDYPTIEYVTCEYLPVPNIFLLLY